MHIAWFLYPFIHQWTSGLLHPLFTSMHFNGFPNYKRLLSFKFDSLFPRWKTAGAIRLLALFAFQGDALKSEDKHFPRRTGLLRPWKFLTQRNRSDASQSPLVSHRVPQCIPGTQFLMMAWVAGPGRGRGVTVTRNEACQAGDLTGTWHKEQVARGIFNDFLPFATNCPVRSKLNNYGQTGSRRQTTILQPRDED